MTARPVLAAVILCSAFMGVSRASALALDVPGTHPTVQAAVAAAAVSIDFDNEITISVSPVTTNLSIELDAAFGPARRLLIRPADGLERVSIVNGAPSVPIVTMTSSGYITLQDLDLLRNVTNNSHLVSMTQCEEVTIERCRIGCNSTTGVAGFSNVSISYPTEIMLRNNILFARTPGTMDYGIDAGSFNDPSNSLRLYNNVVSDHRTFGIRIDAAIAGPLVVLRNNAVVNHTALVVEPVAYRTQVAAGGPTVVTSHNVAFASAASIQTGAGGTQSLIGPTPPFLSLTKADAIPAFVTRTWSIAPPWDANDGLYRLVLGGPMHVDADEYGSTPADVFPDFAVNDDIERDPRPSGGSPHTDRGADQLELGLGLGVGSGDGGSSRLSVAPVRNPARGLALVYASASAGALKWQLFDPAGRLLHHGERDVAVDSRGVLEWRGASEQHAGVVFYRVALVGRSGEHEMRSGRAVLMR